MDFRSYVERNQKVIDFVNDVTPGYIDKYTGTLDYACARFNSILLKLSTKGRFLLYWLSGDLHGSACRLGSPAKAKFQEVILLIF